jgi:hypothetical protein
MRKPDLRLIREPRLRDMLDDPVVQAVMARDKVGRSEIIDLVRNVQARLGARPPHLAA